MDTPLESVHDDCSAHRATERESWRARLLPRTEVQTASRNYTVLLHHITTCSDLFVSSGEPSLSPRESSVTSCSRVATLALAAFPRASGLRPPYTCIADVRHVYTFMPSMATRCAELLTLFSLTMSVDEDVDSLHRVHVLLTYVHYATQTEDAHRPEDASLTRHKQRTAQPPTHHTSSDPLHLAFRVNLRQGRFAHSASVAVRPLGGGLRFCT